jgi:hypothetical protein
MKLVSAACLVASLAVPGIAAANPFPPGGMYVTASGTVIEFVQFDEDTDTTYTLQYFDPILQYSGPIVPTDLDSDGPDDYLVPFTLTALSCISSQGTAPAVGASPNCAPASLSSVDSTFTVPAPGEVRGEAGVATEIVSLYLTGTDVIGTNWMRIAETTLVTYDLEAGDIDSFFDVFFEISIEGPGSETWLPAQSRGTQFQLQEASEVPEPGSLLLLGAGALGLAAVVRRRARTAR